MKITVNTLTSKIDTDNPELLKALIKLYSFKTPGYNYSSAYKNRRWDGTKKFITDTGTFKTGLLFRLLEDLKKINCVPEIVYNTPKSPDIGSHEIKNFQYRDYQEELVKLSLINKRGVISSPVGSGKTLIMAGIVKALYSSNIVILFNAKQLLVQTYEFLEKCGIKDLGVNFGKEFKDGRIMLSTVQSIEKILDPYVSNADALIVDECHEFCNGKITLAALESFPKAQIRLGFTGTHPKEHISLYNLEGALGGIIEVVSSKDLVEEGYLTKPVIQIIERPEPLPSSSKKSYLNLYDEFIVNNDERNKCITDIVNLIREKNPLGAKILILTRSIQHGNILKDLIKFDCEFLEGADSIFNRYEIIKQFKDNKKSSVLIGTKILQTGVNIEEITHMINARGLKSESATIQALGRAVRLHNSKNKAYIYDFLDKEKYLVEHSKKRLKHYKNQGFEVNIHEIKRPSN